MPDKILVAYATNAGSTPRVAETIGDQLCQCGCAAEVRRLDQVDGLQDYNGVVIGAPMILGWHREAVRFIQRNQVALSSKVVAYFATAMSLTRAGKQEVDGTPLFVDPKLPVEPRNPARLSLRERYATPDRYVRPMLRVEPAIKPYSVGLFGGQIDYGRLKLPQLLFVMLIIRAQPGDKRNWQAIRQWATQLAAAFPGATSGRQDGHVGYAVREKETSR